MNINLLWPWLQKGSHMENELIQNCMMKERKVMKMTIYWIPNLTICHFYFSLLKHLCDQTTE
jgi:hypothetical protein